MTTALPTPSYGASLAEVLPAVLGGLGVDGEAGDEPGLEIPVTTRVCLVLVDGLGWSALHAHAGAAPFLSSLTGNPGSRPIDSVFPTTTPVALTSLGTGLAPGQHGVVGLRMRLPEDGQVVDTLALPAQTDMRALQPRPTAFERAEAAGVSVTRVGPRAFDGAGLSEAGLRGGRYAGAESAGERVAAAAHGAAAGDRTLTYVYFGDLDATGHRQGCGSEAWLAELEHVDRVVEQVWAALPPGTTMLVTSDHGMVDVPADARTDVATEPALAAGVEVVAGDLRGVHLHCTAGADADVHAAWQESVGDRFWVLHRDEAVEAGLYGPVVDVHVRARLGDVVVAAKGYAAVVDSRVMAPSLMRLVGLHGSVTEEELVVPLLVAAARP